MPRYGATCTDKSGELGKGEVVCGFEQNMGDLILSSCGWDVPTISFGVSYETDPQTGTEHVHSTFFDLSEDFDDHYDTRGWQCPNELPSED